MAGMYEKHAPVIHRDGLTLAELVAVQTLVALADSGSGQYLVISSGLPANRTAAWTVPFGGTGVTSLTAYALLAGGTTTTGSTQQVSGVGTLGQVLTSNGSGALPTWQAPSGDGTVTSVSVVTNQGVSGSVATSTTTPAITLSLGALTGVTSFNGLVVTANTGAITTGTWTATVVALSYGGTNANLTASNGGIVYSTASAFAILSGTTAGKALLSGNATTPVWSTPTYPSASGGAGTILRSDGTNNVYSTFTIPDTMAINTILYASGANVISALATAASGVLVTGAGAGVPSISTDLPTAVTIGSAYIYRVNGTDVAVADGGTGGSVASITLFNNITGFSAAGTTGTTTTNLVFSTSPALTTPTVVTSIVGGATFAAFNTTTTTLNFAGAATTLNIGASATCILNFGGSTTASEFRFLEPSGSGTNYTAFKAVAQAANITYSLPAAVGAAGTVLTDAAGDGVLSWVAAGTGTVTSVSVVTANGVSGSVATATTTPAITLTLGAITPTTVNGHTFTAGSSTFTGTAAQTYTFPTTSATLARTDAANTFTGIQTITNITFPDQGQLKLTVPTTDLKATGFTTSDYNSGYSSTAIGDLVYLDSSATWQKCDANTVALYNGLLGIALTVAASGAAVTVALPGSFIYSTTGFPTWTIGSPIYMSETPGAMTQTAPTTTDAATRVVGWGVHADKMYFFPSPDYITHT